MKALLTAILLALLFSSAALCQSARDVTASLPVSFTNILKEREYTGSSAISERQNQKLNTQSDALPFFADGQVDSGDDVSISFSGFYADDSGNPSSDVATTTQFLLSLTLTGDDADKYHLTNPSVSIPVSITPQDLKSSDQPEAVAFRKAFENFKLIDSEIKVSTKIIESTLGYYPLRSDSVVVYQSPEGFTVYATKGVISKPTVVGSGRQITLVLTLVGNDNYTLSVSQLSYCSSCGSVILPYYDIYVSPDTIVDYGTTISVGVKGSSASAISGFINYDPKTGTGTGLIKAQQKAPLSVGTHVVTAVATGTGHSKTVKSFNVTVLPISLSTNGQPSIASRPYDATSNLGKVTLPTLDASNLINSDTASLFFSIDSSAVRPSAGTYQVLFVAHLTNPNYSLADSVFSVPFTITPSEVSSVSLSGNELPSTSKVYDGTTDLPLPSGGFPIPNTHAHITAARFSSPSAGSQSIIVDIAADANYTLQGGVSSISNASYPTKGIIYSKQLSVTNPLFSSTSKIYDGTTSAPDFATPPSLVGIVDDDDVSLSFSAAFDSPDAGSRIITTTLSLTGSDAANYTLSSSSLSCQATITPKQLSVTAPLLSSTFKIYDGTTSAPDFSTPPSLVGVVDGDDVSLSFSASFDSPDAGSQIITTTLFLSGSDAANYTLSSSSLSCQASITPKQLSVSAPIFSTTSKIYDGTTSAPDFSTPPSLIGVVDGDDVSLSFSAAFDSPNAGSRTITTSLSLTGSDATNYTLPTSSLSCQATISPKQLSVIAPLFSSTTKVYDGTTSAPDFATLPSLIGVVDGDDVSLSFAAAFDSPDAGARTITTTLSLTGSDAANYTLSSSSLSCQASITPKQLSVSAPIFSSTSKVYDGTSSAPDFATSPSLVGVVDGDDVTLSFAAAFDSPDAGSRTIAVSFSLLGSDAANYTLPTSTLSSQATITPKQLSVTSPLFSSTSKVYDGTTSAPDFATPPSLVGVVDGDDVSLSFSAAFDSPNAGSRTITTSLSLTGSDAANYTLSSSSLSCQATISPKQLSVSAPLFSSTSKVYDGTTSAPDFATPPSLIGVVDGDDVSLSFAAAFDSPDAGARTITTILSLSGSDAANYALPSSSLSTKGTITQRPVTPNADAIVPSRVYDATTAIERRSVTPPTLNNVIPTDSVSAMVVSAEVDNPAPGLRTATISLALVGPDAANYTLGDNTSVTAPVTITQLDKTPVRFVLRGSQPLTYGHSTIGAIPDADIFVDTDPVISGSLSVNFHDSGVALPAGDNLVRLLFTPQDTLVYAIADSTFSISVNPVTLSLIGSFSANGKVYDGTTSVTDTSFVLPTISGVLDGDDVHLNVDSISFASKNIGDNLITAYFSLTGSDAANYTLSTSSLSCQATISPKQLSVTDPLFSSTSKVYGGTTSAPDFATPPSLIGVVDGDDVSLSFAAAFDSPDAGSRTITTSLSLTGSDAANYTLPTSSLSCQATITPKQLTVSAPLFSSTSKVYDGTTFAPDFATPPSLVGVLDGDDVSLSFSAAFDSPDAGSRTITTSLSLTGSDAANYTLSTSSLSCQASIFPKQLSVSDPLFSSTSKVYDGTTSAPNFATSPSLVGVVDGDDVSLSFSAAFDSPDAGSRTITTTLSITGSDAANYILPTTSLSSQATISPKQLTVSAPLFPSTSKVYDGTTSAPDFATPPSLIGVADGDDVTLSFAAAFDSPDAGSRIIVVSFSLLGSDANNYLAPDAYSVAGEIIEPSPTPDPEPDPTPTPDPIVASAIILSATDYGYCATDTIAIALSVESGTPTSYSLTFADALFPDVIDADIPDDFVLHIPVPSSDSFGIVDASLVLHDADNNVSSTAITLTLVRRPDASRLGIKFGNTLFVNNFDNAFSSYQWTADGIDIPGATNQFYYSATLSPAVYACRLTTSSGDVLLSCPLTINSPSSPTTLSISPNPVRSGESVSVRLGNADATLSVELINTNGALCESHTIPNGGSFPVSSPQGAYVVSVSSSSTTAKVKITIK